MQRLLHEGMDAGLCGFSIQRLGPNSVQADFDGTPMVTDTMCDEDILALAEVLRRARRGLHPDHPGHRRHQAPTCAFLEKLAGRGRPAADPRTTWSPPATQGPRGPPARRCAGSRRCRDQGLPIFGQARHGPHRLRLHARALEPLRRQPGVARRHHRHASRRRCAKMQDPELREALVARRPRRPTRCSQVIQAGVGGNPAELVVQGVEPAARTCSKYVGHSRSATSPRRRASTPSR